MPDRDENSTRLHVLTLVIVGGTLLFAFVLYIAVAAVIWLITHPHVLVYGFVGLCVCQAYWLLHAFLRSRYRTRPARDTGLARG